MKIRMTKTIQGSLDGVTVRELVEGREYETVNSPRGDRLARYHIGQRAAVAVGVVTVEIELTSPGDSLAIETVATKPRRRK